MYALTIALRFRMYLIVKSLLLYISSTCMRMYIRAHVHLHVLIFVYLINVCMNASFMYIYELHVYTNLKVYSYVNMNTYFHI